MFVNNTETGPDVDIVGDVDWFNKAEEITSRTFTMVAVVLFLVLGLFFYFVIS